MGSSPSSPVRSPPALPPSLGAHGLLAGVAPADASHWAPRLPDLRTAGALLSTAGLLWEAALRDAALCGETGEEYTARVRDASAAFMDSQALYDRSETMGALGDLMGRSKGEFVLFIGGKDLGKSHMLRELVARLHGQGRRAVLVNARNTGTDLAAGIIDSLKGDRGFFSALLAQLPESARAVASAIANYAVPGSGPVASAALAPPTPPSLRELLDGFVAACAASSAFPVLILDEANRALPSTPGDAAERKATLDVLHRLTLLTKEQRRMNVLLAASEHAEPFRLADLGFKTAHMSRTVVASEVSPAEMRNLLTGHWSCGPWLAEGLMAVYGGHVWQAHLALGGLALDGPAFKAIAGFSPVSGDGVSACCLAALDAGGPHGASLESWLRALATHGYVGIPSRTDPRAELVSQHNVGGVVSESASAPGVPPEAWAAGSGELLVVSSQDGSVDVTWTRPLIPPHASRQPPIVAGATPLTGAYSLGAAALAFPPCGVAGLPFHTNVVNGVAATFVQSAAAGVPAPSAPPAPAAAAPPYSGLAGVAAVCGDSCTAISRLNASSGRVSFASPASPPLFPLLTALDAAARVVHVLAYNNSPSGPSPALFVASLSADTGALLRTCATRFTLNDAFDLASLNFAFDRERGELLIGSCTDAECVAPINVSALHPATCATRDVAALAAEELTAGGSGAVDPYARVLVLSLARGGAKPGLALVALNISSGAVVRVTPETQDTPYVQSLVFDDASRLVYGLAFTTAGYSQPTLVAIDARTGKLRSIGAVAGCPGALPDSLAVSQSGELLFFVGSSGSSGDGATLYTIYAANATIAAAAPLQGAISIGDAPAALFWLP